MAVLKHLTPTIECLSDETVLVQAWKKTSTYIRYHNWFSDTLELDRTAVNLREFIASISQDIRAGKSVSEAIRMVPAPKSQHWQVSENGRWGPVEGTQADAKIRPLAHVSLRDQVIATALMMCLADRVESRQGDPSAKLESHDIHRKVVSYGNRLFSDYSSQGLARYRWGSSTLYRGFFEDYQIFLARPEVVAEEALKTEAKVLVVQSDLQQFYDRVSAQLLQDGIAKLQADDDDPAFFEFATEFLNWSWASDDKEDVDLYTRQSGIEDFSQSVLPQGLAAAGFFANVALMGFDEDLRDRVGQRITPDITLHDFSRYVDDLRFVLSVPASADLEMVRTDILQWIREALTRCAPGLAPQESKTQVSAFRADERPLVQQSRRMARIQAAISGGFDPIAGGEILDSVLALVRAQERLSRDEAKDRYDPFRPIPDVRDATVDRFVAGRFRSTYRSLRPQLWENAEDQRKHGDYDEQSRFRGARTRSELDDETRAFALELLSKWASDPSNVRLLRIALDLWPAAEVLERVLGLLRPFTEKGAPRKAPRRIAWYCLSEIFRAGAVETGFVEDAEQLPAAVDVKEYRRILRQEALKVVQTTGIRLPWYLRQQAYLLLATQPSEATALPRLKHSVIAPYARLLRFLSGDSADWAAAEFATYAVLARRSYLDAEGAVKLATRKLTPARLNHIAQLDPNFATEIVKVTGQPSLLTPRARSDLGLVDHTEITGVLLASIVLSKKTRELLRTERALLSFAAKFLKAIEMVDPASTITPSEVVVVMTSDDLEVDEVRLNPRNLVGMSLYQPPAWADVYDRWRFQLGFLLRFILTAQPDFTRPARRPHWKEQEEIYRPPSGHWHERIFGFFNGHAAFGDDWLPISDWTERLLFGLLWWPGCAAPRNELVSTREETLNSIEDRLSHLRGLQGTSAALLPLRAPGCFQRDGKPLRACVVQMAFPSEQDFKETDLPMSSPEYRIRHRQHLSAALAAVRSSLALRETHKKMDGRLDWLILPELAVHPDDVRTHLVPFARAHKTVILTGLTYQEVCSGEPLVNSALWILPTYDSTRGMQILIRRQGKKYLAPSEKDYLDKGLVRSFRPCQWLIGYQWSANPDKDPLWLSASICFDATDLCLAADLKNHSDIFAITAMNRDVNTFDNMAVALHYHMHQLVVVANNGNYGGSNAYAPFKDALKRRLFHMHGQPQASIAFFELENIDAFKARAASGDFKPSPAGASK
ncbi:MAG: RNA-directed DNA polymerase [Brevundimonas sp.]